MNNNACITEIEKEANYRQSPMLITAQVLQFNENASSELIHKHKCMFFFPLKMIKS